MGKELRRFLVWVTAAALLCFLTAYNFPSLLSQSLSDTFGSLFPAIPFAALLTAIFALRWGDLREKLSEERGLFSEPLVRLVGAAVVLCLVFSAGLTGTSVVLSGIAVVLTFYGSSLAVIPGARRLILPYAATYAFGVAAPSIIQWALGDPLVSVSTALSTWVVSLTGIPITWQGPQFALVSRTGDLVSATITPGCSSVISVTTFLGLLALMHFDMKKDVKSTAELAVGGVVALTLLNSLRIAILIWVGYSSGAAALWDIHNWVGYAIFLGFYMVALVIYSRMGVGKDRIPRGALPLAPAPSPG